MQTKTPCSGWAPAQMVLGLPDNDLQFWSNRPVNVHTLLTSSSWGYCMLLLKLIPPVSPTFSVRLMMSSSPTRSALLETWVILPEPHIPGFIKSWQFYFRKCLQNLTLSFPITVVEIPSTSHLAYDDNFLVGHLGSFPLFHPILPPLSEFSSKRWNLMCHSPTYSVSFRLGQVQTLILSYKVCLHGCHINLRLQLHLLHPHHAPCCIWIQVLVLLSICYAFHNSLLFANNIPFAYYLYYPCYLATTYIHVL